MPVTIELTPRLTQELAGLVRNGVQLQTAARALGVPASSLHRWMNYGARGGVDTPTARAYRELVDAIRDARRERDLDVQELLARSREHLLGPSVRVISTGHQHAIASPRAVPDVVAPLVRG